MLRNNKRRLISPPTDAVTKIKYNYSGIKNIGDREQQQDMFGYIDGINANVSADFIAVLCDGMGGMADGALASQNAVQIMLNNLQQCNEFSYDVFLTLIDSVSAGIVDIANSRNMMGQIGTTLLSVVCNNGEINWCSVGDSRIYLIRDDKIAVLNHDHNYLSQLIDDVIDGNISRMDAFNNPKAQALTSYIGQASPQIVDASFRPLKLLKGDKIVLASDGMFGTLSDGEILDICIRTNIKNLANNLVNSVLSKGKMEQDNTSVIAIEYLGE